MLIFNQGVFRHVDADDWLAKYIDLPFIIKFVNSNCSSISKNRNKQNAICICACIINVSSVLWVAILLTLNYVLIATPASCLNAIYPAGAVELHALLSANTCIAVKCKTIHLSVASSSYNLNTPYLNIMLIGFLWYCWWHMNWGCVARANEVLTWSCVQILKLYMATNNWCGCAKYLEFKWK